MFPLFAGMRARPEARVRPRPCADAPAQRASSRAKEAPVRKLAPVVVAAALVAAILLASSLGFGEGVAPGPEPAAPDRGAELLLAVVVQTPAGQVVLGVIAGAIVVTSAASSAALV